MGGGIYKFERMFEELIAKFLSSKNAGQIVIVVLLALLLSPAVFAMFLFYYYRHDFKQSLISNSN